MYVFISGFLSKTNYYFSPCQMEKRKFNLKRLRNSMYTASNTRFLIKYKILVYIQYFYSFKKYKNTIFILLFPFWR